MKTKLVALLIVLSNGLSAQMDVSGVKIPFIYKTDESVLIVNGAGVRVKYFMDMYVGALYIKVKTNDAQKIINADEDMCIKLHMISGLITSEKMNEATDEGFKKSAGTNIAMLQSRINQFKSVFSEKINKEDVFDLVYESKKGLSVFKNGKFVITIAGLDFKKALFGIWLCTKPADTDLKQEMLGL